MCSGGRSSRAWLPSSASCPGGHHTTAERPTSTRGTTTTTTGASNVFDPGADAWPLTGLHADDLAKRNRPALVVKIDNAPLARPPTGINAADIVVEEKVEDGVTRFFTIFHSADADVVGPVRSARTTDIELVGALNHPLFAYAGANARFQALVNQAPLIDVGVNRAPADYV